jgi:hypothetical protein
MLFVPIMYGLATFIFARANLGQPAYLLEQVGPIDSLTLNARIVSNPNKNC